MKKSVIILIILAVGTFSLGLGYWIGVVSSSVQEKFETINSQLKELDKVNTTEFEETFIYGEKGFQLMKDHFNADPSYRAALNRQIESGDTNAMKLKELFNTPYESISTIGMSKQEIDDLILVFSISKNVSAEFNTRPLPETASAEIKRKADSLNNSIDKIVEEFKKQQLEESENREIKKATN